jgi:hypothetical protein
VDWSQLLIGGRVRLRLPSGDAGRSEVELVGRLLGRDQSRFVDLSVPAANRDPENFRALIQLADGTIVLAPLDSITGRVDE